VSKFELPKLQFERTFRHKISCKTHLEQENYCFKNIFGILMEFSILQLKKQEQNLVQSGRKAVSKFELPKPLFERTVKSKIAGKTHFE